MGALNDMEYDDSDMEQGEPTPATPKRRTKSKEPCSGEKPRPAPRSGNKGRHKSSSKGGSRKCKSCQQTKEASEYAFNQANCKICKAALDNVWKKAKAQGPKVVEWLRETLEDAAATKRMLASYADAMAKSSGRTGRKEAWSIVTYMEIVKSTSKTKRTDRDQLMWRLQAIDFWKSLPGGGLSHAQAEKKWNGLEETYQELNLEHDHEGPPGEALRLPVSVATFVDNSNAVSRTKPRS